MKKALALILTLIMVLGLMPAAMAATAPASQQQIGNYTPANDTDGTLGDPTVGIPAIKSLENGKVIISKTIAGTETENEFEITLKVKTTETIENVSSAPDAAVVLVLDVSGSMEGDRLSSAKAAAQAFINSFAKDAGNAQRKVAIVKFSGDYNIDGAKTVQGWTEASSLVKTDDQQCDAIKNLSAGGGTNLHAGLLLAKNLLNNSSVKDIENKSIVLLSDGKPTFYVEDKEANSQNEDVICKDGNSMGGDGRITNHNTHTKVETLMKSDDLKGINKYAVYIGDEDIECTSILSILSCKLNKPTSDWLRYDCGFSTYSVKDLTSLTGIFENIVKSILIKAQAWMVTDPMGTNIQFAGFTDCDSNATNEDNGTISWDLKKDNEYTTDTQGTTTTRTYTCKYKVKLDTLAQGFEANKEYPTNGITTLTYVIEKEGQTVTEADLKTAYFNVPSVKGFAGNLTFTKVDADKQPLKGAKFTLTKDGWEMTATSGEDGQVKFENIPSGHTYTLTETQPPEGYQGLDDTYTVEVAYGVAVLKKGADTVTAIVNTPKETPTGSLTIEKVFTFEEGEDPNTRPDSITFTVQQIVQEGEPGHSETVTLTPNDSWKKTIDNVPVGEYTVTEGDAKIDGYTYTPVQNPTGNITVAATGTAAVTFTNTYKKLSPDTKEITFNVSKTVEQKGNVAPGTNTFNFEFTIFTEGIEDAAINNSDYIVTIGGNTITPDVTGKYGFSITVNGATTQTVQVKVQGETAKIDNIAGLKVSETGTAPEYWTYDNKEAKSAQAGVAATFTNTYTKMEDNTGSLTVKKTVSGGGASYNKEFTFTVTLKENNDPQNGEVTYGGVTFTNGVATFTLKHNQEKSITGIPAGCTYTVTENADGYTQSITSGSATGTIENGKTATVTFNNYKSGGDHYYPTPDPVPPIVIPPNTGDMTIWQSILHFLGIR